MATIQILQHYLITSDKKPREVVGAIMNRETRERLEYCHLKSHPKYQDTWKKSYGNGFGRLAQGMPGRLMETNTMFFITKDKMLSNSFQDVTYRRIICDYQEGKAEPNRKKSLWMETQ